MDVDRDLSADEQNKAINKIDDDVDKLQRDYDVIMKRHADERHQLMMKFGDLGEVPEFDENGEIDGKIGRFVPLQ